MLMLLSGDQALMSAYNDGDVYYALAKLCGLTSDNDKKRWKNENQTTRQRMKSLQLGINYGMGIMSLAKGLDRHPLIASAVIDKHKRQYPRFWDWRADAVNSAMLERQMESVFGWPVYLSHSPNERSLYNFPMQANGAEMLRIAAVKMCEAGIVPNMLIHDGLLIEATDEGQIDHAREIMRGRPRGLRRIRDRRGYRSADGTGSAVSRQAADRPADVARDHGGIAGSRGDTEGGTAMSGTVNLDRFRSKRSKQADNGEKTARFKQSAPKELFDKVKLVHLQDRRWDDLYPANARLFHYLGIRSRRGQRSVLLTNTMAAEIGLSRERKRACLRDLERRGLIAVERQGQKNSASDGPATVTHNVTALSRRRGQHCHATRDSFCRTVTLRMTQVGLRNSLLTSLSVYFS